MELGEALLAYPQFTVTTASAGAWFAGVIQPVADLHITSTVATFFPFDLNAPVSSWAWWSDGVWIGPRHTYLDGSICAYERQDMTWSRDKGARLLLDLTSLGSHANFSFAPTVGGLEYNAFTRPSSVSCSSDQRSCAGAAVAVSPTRVAVMERTSRQ